MRFKNLMRPIIILSIVVIIVMSISLIITRNTYAQEINTRNIKDVMQTYAYVYAQNYTLHKIIKKYPKFKTDVQLATLEFNAQFEGSYKNIKAKLYAIPEAKGPIEEQIDKTKALLGADFNRSTIQDIKAFINTVRLRAKGKIESPILETLLSFNPVYNQNPTQEIFDGYVSEYKDTRSTKAKGIKFALQVPKSWKAKEGRRPNVVKKFVSSNGVGSGQVIILILDGGGKVVKDDVQQLISSGEVKSLLPPGSSYVSAKYYEVDNTPGLRITFNSKRNLIDDNLSYFTYNMYSFFYRDKIIQLMCGVYSFEGYPESDFNNNAKLFEWIVNSLVIYNQYE